MFSFYWPWMILLLPLPFLVRLFRAPNNKNSDMQELRFSYIQRLQAAFPNYSNDNKKSSNWYKKLLALLWLALVLAIMQPQFVDKFTSVKNKGYDLMLAVDLSGSMKALDFSTQTERIDRLDVTKKVVTEFVNQRQGDRIGLILFGQQAYLQVPLTLDTLSVAQMLNNAIVGMAGDSTAIGDALGLAVRNLRDRPKESRVIILLTDGEDNASSIPPLQAADLAKQYGIRIYTIGVGNDGAVPFPDGNGNIVMAQLGMDEDLLKEIAAKTDGSYFKATDTQSLEEIYQRINAMEKTEAQSREYLIREPLYRYPLGTALALLMIITISPLFRRATYA
jgi:Ca-activated chloride channel family protein